MTRIYCLNGPNLNLLGTREPEIYGTTTLVDIARGMEARLADTPFELVFRQTNSEGALVDLVQEAGAEGLALILNAGAYTHTSIALHDALRAISVPSIEVHLSNPAAREGFRQTNFVSSAVNGSIAGFGANGYDLALTEIIRRLTA